MENSNKLDKLHIINTHYYEEWKVFKPLQSKVIWLLAEKGNIRRAIFAVNDLNVIDSSVITEIVETNEIDEVLIVIRRMPRRDRNFEIPAKIIIKHIREFNLRKTGK